MVQWTSFVSILKLLFLLVIPTIFIVVVTNLLVFLFFKDTCLQPFSVQSPYEIEVPGDCGYLFEMIDGVVQITACKRKMSSMDTVTDNPKPVIHHSPSLEEFFEDQNILLALSTHGPM